MAHFEIKIEAWPKFSDIDPNFGKSKVAQSSRIFYVEERLGCLLDDMGYDSNIFVKQLDEPKER